MSPLRLPPTTDSVPVARRHARDQLRHSSADIDTVVLLVSEVVTNAVLHARSDVFLTVQDQGRTARVEVRDSSPMPPRLHRFSAESRTWWLVISKSAATRKPVPLWPPPATSVATSLMRSGLGSTRMRSRARKLK